MEEQLEQSQAVQEKEGMEKLKAARQEYKKLEQSKAAHLEQAGAVKYSTGSGRDGVVKGSSEEEMGKSKAAQQEGDLWQSMAAQEGEVEIKCNYCLCGMVVRSNGSPCIPASICDADIHVPPIPRVQAEDRAVQARQTRFQSVCFTAARCVALEHMPQCLQNSSIVSSKPRSAGDPSKKGRSDAPPTAPASQFRLQEKPSKVCRQKSGSPSQSQHAPV